MSIIFAFVVCLIFIYLSWCIGHIITKQLKLQEENKLLSHLINISLGFASILITVNFISRITRDFNIGLITTFLLVIGLIAWRFKDLQSEFLSFIQLFKNKNLVNFIDKNTDRYFWILLGVTNFVYGVTAFSSTKLNHYETSNSHVVNINQLISGTYPPKYSFTTTINQVYHYGADIFGAIVSKLSTAHPETSLDILTLIFLNLTFLTLIALTNKFIKPLNLKLFVPFAALFAWGPVTVFFSKDDSLVGKKLMEKLVSISQNQLGDYAEWSGLVLHWFFDPPSGFSVFIFLIALYLLYKLLFEEKSLRFLILLGVFLSSLLILDVFKLILILLGFVIYLLFLSSVPFLDDVSAEEKAQWLSSLKRSGMLVLIILFLGLLYGNWMVISKDTIPFVNLFNIENEYGLNKVGPLKTNLILLAVYAFGFYLAFKEDQKWVIFLISFFVLSLISPFLISISQYSSGQMAMAGNLLGAFSLPFVIDFIKKKFDVKGNNQTFLYTGLIIIFSFSTIMFFAFGDKTSPIFQFSDKGILHFSGIQQIPFAGKSDETSVLKAIKSKNIKNSAILTEPSYAELFTTNAGLINPLTINEAAIASIPIKSDAAQKYISIYKGHYYPIAFSFNSKSWLEQNIKWVYMTPRFFKCIMCPESRIKFLNSYFEKANQLVHSNKETIDFSKSKELFNVEPKLLKDKIKNNYPTLVEEFLASSKPETSFYLKQIALCPYLGVYNAMSNDFDGDKIADIAFFDQQNKKWFIVYGKDQKEEEIDLATNILKDYSESDLFIPLPSDYDGDSKTDIALFNRSNALWSILPASHSEKEKNEGPFEFEIKFKGGTAGKAYPLFITGRRGAADVIYVGYKKKDEIYFGFDHWGAAPTVSKTTKINPNRFYKMEISLGNIYPESSTNPDLLKSLVVKLDGKEAFKINANFYPTTKEQILLGKNDIGASTCTKEFPGDIQNVHRLVAYESRKWGGGLNEFPLPTYLDDDNLTDFSVFTGENQVKWPTLLSSTNYGYQEHRFRVSYTDTQVFGDVDGDKKDDFIIYNANENSFKIYLSTKNHNESTRFIAKMSETDKKSLPRVVVADYDGDKKVDLALWYPEEGKWDIAYAKDMAQAINQISNVTAQAFPFVGCGGRSASNPNPTLCVTKTFLLGSAGDIPMPGDYNGDGTAEIAVLNIETYNLEIVQANGVKKSIDLSKYKNLMPASFIGI